MLKRILSFMMMLLLLCSLSVPVLAETIDETKLGSISFNMSYKGNPVPGGTLTMYRVADIAHSDGDYSFVYTAGFESCTVPVTKLDSAEIGPALAAIAAQKNLAGTTQTMDSKGHTSFVNVKPGLYLFVQNRAADGYSKLTPFLVSLPGKSDGVYNYNVEATPKLELKPAPTPGPTAPPGGYLPQSGQVNWPVPVLAVFGFFLISSGLCLKVSQRRKKYEE